MAKTFNPGNYKKKITFLQREPGQDDYGDPVDAWTPVKAVWASKSPILGNEFFAALTTENKVEVKFNMRFTKGIASEMRIQHGTEVYEIIGEPINVDSANKELLCYCRLVKE